MEQREACPRVTDDKGATDLCTQRAPSSMNVGCIPVAASAHSPRPPPPCRELRILCEWNPSIAHIAERSPSSLSHVQGPEAATLITASPPTFPATQLTSLEKSPWNPALVWGDDTLLFCSKRWCSVVLARGSALQAECSSLAGEGGISLQVWDETGTSKSIKIFHLPKDTNAQVNTAATELDWAHHTNELWWLYCFLDCLVRLSKVTFPDSEVVTKMSFGETKRGNFA